MTREHVRIHAVVVEVSVNELDYSDDYHHSKNLYTPILLRIVRVIGGLHAYMIGLYERITLLLRFRFHSRARWYEKLLAS